MDTFFDVPLHLWTSNASVTAIAAQEEWPPRFAAIGTWRHARPSAWAAFMPWECRQTVLPQPLMRAYTRFNHPLALYRNASLRMHVCCEPQQVLAHGQVAGAPRRQLHLHV